MFRPIGANVLVSCHPHKERSSLVHIGDNKTGVRTGTVIRVGKKVKDISVGEKVAFARENKEHQNGKLISFILCDLVDNKEELVLLSETSIFFSYEGDLRVDR